MVVKKLREQQAGATREALMKSARELFTERGFAATATEEIVERAGMTRGALYHHFSDKQDLFRTVVVQMVEEMVTRVDKAAGRTDGAWQRLVAAADAYLDACLDPAVQQILVLDTPSVLGWREWCSIDQDHNIAAFERLLSEGMAERAIETQDPGPLALVLIGALNVAARVIADAPNKKAARAQVGETVSRLIGGLRTETP